MSKNLTKSKRKKKNQNITKKKNKDFRNSAFNEKTNKLQEAG